MISVTSIVPSALYGDGFLEMLNGEFARAAAGARDEQREAAANASRTRRESAAEARQGGLSAAYDVAPPKLTLGTSRSAGALISKNSRGLKLNMPAMMLEGNWAIFVFRSRTTAL